jgi:sugar/nucleoside kinase (ribokinase family)
MLQVPGATSYMGSIGKDKYGEAMKKDATAAGVYVSLLYVYQLLIIGGWFCFMFNHQEIDC